jgi:hypothetical protein
MGTIRSQRFDDIVRSERYFTATLLPAILLHARPCGLDDFLQLVSRKALRQPGPSTERDARGVAMPRGDRSPTWSPGAVELITEFHIARDLKLACRLATTDLSLDKERPRRKRVAEAPDGVACWRYANPTSMGDSAAVSARRVPDPGPSEG